MLKIVCAGLLAAAVLAGNAAPARAFQTIVTQIEKTTDGTTTYHFAVKLDPGETLTPGAGKVAGDFITVYNFYGLIENSVKSPPGWEFSSEEFGRTPMLNGYPMVLPVDVPNTPNLTFTATKPVAAGAEIDGFVATTKSPAVVQGEYSAQVTRQSPAVTGAPAAASKQALIGTLPTPSFLADVK